MRTLRPIALACILAGCGEPTAATPDAATDGGVPDDGGAIDAGADGGAPSSCSPGAFPGALGEGTWDPRFTVAGFADHDGIPPIVHDLAVDADGATWATGRFHFLGADRVEPLLRTEGTAWTEPRDTWELAPTLSGFSALAHGPAGALALATSDAFRDRLTEIWIDDGSGLRVIAHVTGVVRRLAFVGGALWAAGPMTIDEGGVSNLAVWDGTSWSAPPGGPADEPVYALLPEGDAVVVGGMFTQIGGIAARLVARFDGTTWTAHDVAFGGPVYALARDAAGDLHAGGSIPYDDSLTVGGLLRWNGSGWDRVGGGLANGTLWGNVADLVLHDSDLHAIGCFTHANGASSSESAIEVRSIVRWDGSQWHPMDDEPGGSSAWFGFATCGDEGPLAIFDATHQRLASDGERLYLGGSFGAVDGVATQSIAVYEDGAWHAQGEGGDGLTGYADRLAIGGPDCAVHALGPMSHAAGEPLTSRVVRWDDGWTEIGDALPPGGWCTGLAVDPSGAVYVACNDLEAAVPAGELLVLSGGSWTTAATAPDVIQDVAVDAGGRVWVVGGGETGFVARLEGGALETVAEANGLVLRVAVEGSRLLIGGGFTEVGGVAATRIAAWDDEAFSALGAGLPGTPMAIAIDGDDVYVTTADEGMGLLGLGRWDGATWTELATPAHGVPSLEIFSPRAIVARDGQVVVAGAIIVEEGDRPRSAYWFDGTTFRPLGGGVGSLGLDAILLADDALWVAGAMAIAGADGEETSSVGIGRFAWAP